MNGRIATDPLAEPVGALMRPTDSVAPEDSLERGGQELRRNGACLLPLVDEGGYLRGAISEASLARALADGVELRSPAAIANVPVLTIAPYASGAEALRRLADSGGDPLVVVDDQGRVMGMLLASDLLPRRRVHPRPSMVGGMATPLGVYLTNGAIRGGAPQVGLVLTGALLFCLLFSAQLVVTPLVPLVDQLPVPMTVKEMIVNGIPLILFLAGLRLVPLAGTHGAEHQVVHALERGEELVPEVVARMPRVHPRCGTNFAAAAFLFLGLFGAEWIPWQDVRFLVAALVTLFLWRPLGSLLQQHVTTRKPSEAQLKGAIHAAEQLCERYASARISTPSIPIRIWNSGLLHVISGSVLMTLLIYGVAALFGWDVPL